MDNDPGHTGDIDDSKDRIWNPFDLPTRKHFPDWPDNLFEVRQKTEVTAHQIISTPTQAGPKTFPFDKQAQYLDSCKSNVELEQALQQQSNQWFAENARHLSLVNEEPNPSTHNELPGTEQHTAGQRIGRRGSALRTGSQSNSQQLPALGPESNPLDAIPVDFSFQVQGKTTTDSLPHLVAVAGPSEKLNLSDYFHSPSISPPIPTSTSTFQHSAPPPHFIPSPHAGIQVSAPSTSTHGGSFPAAAAAAVVQHESFQQAQTNMQPDHMQTTHPLGSPYHQQQLASPMYPLTFTPSINVTSLQQATPAGFNNPAAATTLNIFLNVPITMPSHQSPIQQQQQQQQQVIPNLQAPMQYTQSTHTIQATSSTAVSQPIPSTSIPHSPNPSGRNISVSEDHGHLLSLHPASNAPLSSRGAHPSQFPTQQPQHSSLLQQPYQRSRPPESSADISQSTQLIPTQAARDQTLITGAKHARHRDTSTHREASPAESPAEGTSQGYEAVRSAAQEAPTSSLGMQAMHNTEELVQLEGSVCSVGDHAAQEGDMCNRCGQTLSPAAARRTRAPTRFPTLFRSSPKRTQQPGPAARQARQHTPLRDDRPAKKTCNIAIQTYSPPKDTATQTSPPEDPTIDRQPSNIDTQQPLTTSHAQSPTPPQPSSPYVPPTARMLSFQPPTPMKPMSPLWVQPETPSQGPPSAVRQVDTPSNSARVDAQQAAQALATAAHAFPLPSPMKAYGPAPRAQFHAPAAASTPNPRTSSSAAFTPAGSSTIARAPSSLLLCSTVQTSTPATAGGPNRTPDSNVQSYLHEIFIGHSQLATLLSAQPSTSSRLLHSPSTFQSQQQPMTAVTSSEAQLLASTATWGQSAGMLYPSMAIDPSLLRYAPPSVLTGVINQPQRFLQPTSTHMHPGMPGSPHQAQLTQLRATPAHFSQFNTIQHSKPAAVPSNQAVMQRSAALQENVPPMLERYINYHV